MLNSIFTGLFDTTATSVISVGNFLLCIGVSLVIGLILALAYCFKSRYTKSFVITLALLPAVVCVVIMMVNGNIGAGVAVAGAFGLVRFRSVPGTAKEIAVLFLAMGAGLISGMGYLAYGVLFAIVMSLILIIYNMSGLGGRAKSSSEKTLSITIPEDLDYSGMFDDLFAEYTTGSELISVKTSNMGSLYKLKYDLTLKDASKEKEFLDKVRTRNGNLEISMQIKEIRSNEL